MSQLRIIGLGLIILGIVAFSYQGVITFTTREKILEAGPIQVTAEKTTHISLPPALGALALAGGVTLLVVSVKKA